MNHAQCVAYAFLAISLFPPISVADIYRCPAPDGSSVFTDLPCNNGDRNDNGSWVNVEDEAREIRAKQEAEEARKAEKARKDVEAKERYWAKEISRTLYEALQLSEPRDPLTELYGLLRCEMTYSSGLEHIFITATDETGTYAINGKARGAAASRGWIDGYKKFSPEQMKILLQIGLTKCK